MILLFSVYLKENHLLKRNSCGWDVFRNGTVYFLWTLQAQGLGEAKQHPDRGERKE